MEILNENGVLNNGTLTLEVRMFPKCSSITTQNTLGQDVLKLFLDDEIADVSFKVQDHTFPAHRLELVVPDHTFPAHRLELVLPIWLISVTPVIQAIICPPMMLSQIFSN
jgi:hypothetical protein